MFQNDWRRSWTHAVCVDEFVVDHNEGSRRRISRKIESWLEGLICNQNNKERDAEWETCEAAGQSFWIQYWGWGWCLWKVLKNPIDQIRSQNYHVIGPKRENSRHLQSLLWRTCYKGTSKSKYSAKYESDSIRCINNKSNQILLCFKILFQLRILVDESWVLNCNNNKWVEISVNNNA